MKRSSLRLFLLITAISLVFVAGVAFLHARSSFRAMDELTMCDESSAAEVRSPDGQYVAAAFIRNCGATTDYVTHANLRKANETYAKDQFGAVRSGEVFSALGKVATQLHWISETELEIKTPASEGSAHVQVNSNWNGVHVRVEQQ